MAGPRTEAEARTWIRTVIDSREEIVTQHFELRMRERHIDITDARRVLRRAPCEAYPEPPRRGGSCWRAWGRADDGRQLGIGVEAFTEGTRRRIVLCTLFERK